jgi:hypothetical protein
MLASLETKGTRNDDQARNLHHVLHGSHWVHLGGYSGKGVGAVKSYRDYLDMKNIRPIVIHRTTKRSGDKVIVTSCKPAETAK